jgi:serine/threonine protein kinase/tetratricopeptide (TPR) repeat protein
MGQPGLQSAGRAALRFPEPGRVVAGFRIVGELGRGAFARVYLAEQLGLADRPVVLKIARALGAEPRTLARLQHTHIVPIHSVHDDSATGLRLLCMPYFGGANLSQLLNRVDVSLPTQATGRSLVEALDQVGGRPPSSDEPTRRRSSLSGRSGKPLARAATRSVGTPSAVRSLWGRQWARFSLFRRLDAGSVDVPAAATDPGQPARQFLRAHSYVQAAVWIAARLAEGLEHAHARGMLHRDLKPANILIAADGTPMLLDFNLAFDRRAEAMEGESAVLGGTLPYMAPEHLDAFNPHGSTPPEAVDERSDIYSLGLVLFEMVAGRHPFADPAVGLDRVAALRRMTQERRQGAASARSLNPQVPWSLDAILRKCLEPDPSRRYQGAGELAEDLRCFLADQPLRHAAEPSLRERLAKWARRHPRARSGSSVGAAAAALILGLVALIGTISGHLTVARAQVHRTAFSAEFDQCRLLLNTISGPAGHLRRGVERSRRLLAEYGVTGPGDWTAGPDVRALGPAERRELREDMAELVLLLARAQIVLAARGPEPQRRQALQEGVAWLDRAERFDPRPSAALYEERAGFHTALGQAAAARADRARAARIAPSTSRDFYLMGTALLAQGRTERAEGLLGRAVALDARRFWAWFALGLCHYDQARYTEAAADFGVCAALAPAFAWPHHNRGLALARACRLAEARAAYDQALAVSPNFIEARVNRALACLELNDAAQAAVDLERALALGRRDPYTLTAHAEALARLGRSVEAERDFAQALRDRPDDPALLAARGMFRLANDPERAHAETDFARALALDPHCARAHLGLAHLRRPSDPRAALDEVDQALADDPDLAEALQLRALLRARRGDSAAVADCERLARTPTPYNLYNAACALAVLSESTREARHSAAALEFLRRALEAGFPRARAASDPDLQSLRNRPEFRSLNLSSKSIY